MSSTDKSARKLTKGWLLLIPLGFMIMLLLGVLSMFTYVNYTGVYDCASSHNKGGGCYQSQVDEHVKYENYMFAGLFLSMIISFVVIIIYPSKKNTDITSKESI